MKDNKNIKTLLKLFWAFFKIGAFTFGGGYAMIPVIQQEVCEKNKYIENEEIVDIFAMSQSLPGVLSVNASIFTGYKIAGVAGAVVSAAAIILPAMAAIFIIYPFMVMFKENIWVEYAFEGIRAGIVTLMLIAVIKLYKTSIVDKVSFFIMLAVVVLGLFTGINTAILLVIGAVIGVTRKIIEIKKISKKDKKEDSGDNSK